MFVEGVRLDCVFGGVRIDGVRCWRCKDRWSLFLEV